MLHSDIKFEYLSDYERTCALSFNNSVQNLTPHTILCLVYGVFFMKLLISMEYGLLVPQIWIRVTFTCGTSQDKVDRTADDWGGDAVSSVSPAEFRPANNDVSFHVASIYEPQETISSAFFKNDEQTPNITCSTLSYNAWAPIHGKSEQQQGNDQRYRSDKIMTLH